ncbi:unnamed protein product [Sphenostylis stenocarpa]|uniref:NYN domain-containing protein n=1 Tax=Sphenostylis stenocarpa TaxID=92480 RepID=A0AA86TI12_9FABA|nr:unnamed protein product [Sphenostylis stenocarpa]
MNWFSQNPPPAHLFLISADKDFAAMLHQLKNAKLQYIACYLEGCSSCLFSAATITWQWSSLVKGKNLSGKHFNHPPDGSWCGDYKVILKNPVSDVEKSSSSQIVDIYEPSEDIHTDPKEVVIQICHVLRSYPLGISTVDLCAELKKRKVYFESVRSYIKIEIDEKESTATPNLNGEDKNKARQENVSRTPNVLQKFSVCSGKVIDEVCQNSYSLPVDDSMPDKMPSRSDKTYRNGPSFFGWIRSWVQFWKVQIVNDFKERKLSGLDQPEFLPGNSFWDDMETFIFTLKGSFIVSQEDMMHKLQKYGPQFLELSSPWRRYCSIGGTVNIREKVFPFGFVPLKTLPDGHIDLTAFCEDQHLEDSLIQDIQRILEREQKNEEAQFHVKEVQYIRAKVKIIKCLVENFVVDISFNQISGLGTLVLLRR